MAYTILETEYVEINGVPLATPAWTINDLSPLWDAATLRGDDRVVPFSDGAYPLRRFRDEMRVQIPITIYGQKKWDDTDYANVRIGLMTNVDHIRTNLLTPATTSDGTWNLILHLPDGTTRSAACFVIPPIQIEGLGPSAVRGVLDIVIPQGFLA